MNITGFHKYFYLLAPLGDDEIDLNLEVKFGCYDGGPSNGIYPKMTIDMDYAA